MKKSLNTYTEIEGLSEYDEWSYCSGNGMWYEDAKEVLPQPFWHCSSQIHNLRCELKIGYGIFDEDWDGKCIEADPYFDLAEYAQYIIGKNNYEDCVSSVFLLDIQGESKALGFSEYGVWGLEDFAKKLKTQSFAAQYIEQWRAVKLIAWTNEKNKTRFIAYAYGDCEREFARIIFDMTVERDLLVSQIENAITSWKGTLLNELEKQWELARGGGLTPNLEDSIKHFFPDFYKKLAK